MADKDSNMARYNVLNRPVLSPKEFVERVIKNKNCSITKAISTSAKLLGVSEGSLKHWYYGRKNPVEITVYYWCAEVAQEEGLS